MIIKIGTAASINTPTITNKNPIKRNFPFNLISGLSDFSDSLTNKKPGISNMAVIININIEMNNVNSKCKVPENVPIKVVSENIIIKRKISKTIAMIKLIITINFCIQTLNLS